jgi:gas vesicle protein
MNKVMISLLAGVAIGVLLAPDKGSETVKRLRNRLNDLKDEAVGKGDDLAVKAKRAINRGAMAVNESHE